jgi:hypothetical protein
MLEVPVIEPKSDIVIMELGVGAALYDLILELVPLTVKDLDIRAELLWLPERVALDDILGSNVSVVVTVALNDATEDALTELELLPLPDARTEIDAIGLKDSKAVLVLEMDEDLVEVTLLTAVPLPTPVLVALRVPDADSAALAVLEELVEREPDGLWDDDRVALTDLVPERDAVIEGEVDEDRDAVLDPVLVLVEVIVSVTFPDAVPVLETELEPDGLRDIDIVREFVVEPDVDLDPVLERVVDLEAVIVRVTILEGVPSLEILGVFEVDVEAVLERVCDCERVITLDFVPVCVPVIDLVLVADKDALRVPVLERDVDVEPLPDLDIVVDLVPLADRLDVLDADIDAVSLLVAAALFEPLPDLVLDTVLVLERDALVLLDGEAVCVPVLEPLLERVTVGLVVEVLDTVVVPVLDRVELVDFVPIALTLGLREPDPLRLTVTEPVFVLEGVDDRVINAELEVVFEESALLDSDCDAFVVFVISALFVPVLVDVGVRVGNIGITANSL